MIDPSAAALLRASGLPGRWRGRERFVILAAGSIGARAFLAAWKMWREDANRCERLNVIALGSRWPTADELAFTARDAGADEWLRQLPAAWPPLAANLHRLAFEGGRVQLLLAAGDASAELREIVANVDAFLVAEAGAARCVLVEAPRVAKALARLAAPNATLVACGLDEAALKGLQAAGFRVDARSSSAAVGITGARHEPHFAPKRPIGRPAASNPPDKRVLIIGAGLAGCAAAWALAEQGWHSTVFERQPSIAAEGSGNPAGLFHGIVNGQDGTHARFNRAAALEAQRAVTTALADHRTRGAVRGLLQLVDAEEAVPEMRSLLQRLHLPADYVRATDADEASALAGLSLTRPGWFYPGGGWVEPRGLARSFLERAGSAVEVRCGVDVAALRRDGSKWHVLAADGRVIDTAFTVVFANAGEALRLSGGAWPVESVRGQLSMLSAADAAGLTLPHVPIAGSGYLLPDIEGQLIFGATAAPGDDDPAVRLHDHQQNLAQLARLAPTIAAVVAIDPARLHGRTGWRWTSRDRLPLIGPVARTGGSLSGATDAAMRLDQPRFIPREAGLFMFAALGSRGITWCALGAQLLASSVTGAPSPVEASLLDAVDPARFIVRSGRAASRNTR